MELYSSNKVYTYHYDSELLRGIDDLEFPRPWNLENEILKHSGRNKKLLDVGCGTAFKLIPLAPHFQYIVGLDPSTSMLNAAQTNINHNNLTNVTLIEGRGECLPFSDKEFDVVTCMLSRWEISELHRVLKPDGIVIIEHIGCEDKKEFKLFFGRDEGGWRGQFINSSKEEFLNFYTQSFSKFFKNVHIQNGYWKTIYTKKGLIELLKQTPTIRNFNEYSDKIFLKSAIEKFSIDYGKIKLIQNRILIHAKNF